MGLARKGDVESFRAYVRSDAFLADLIGIDPDRRQSALRCYARAEALCEGNARHPLVKPRPIDASHAHKVDWKNDPVIRAKLADAYAVARLMMRRLRAFSASPLVPRGWRGNGIWVEHELLPTTRPARSRPRPFASRASPGTGQPQIASVTG
jgi:hypothetical protein